MSALRVRHRKTEVPTSTATNAYDLLTDVVKAVLAEPKRLNMGRWLLVTKTQLMGISRVPSCGTVGCLAGWLVTLTAPPAKRRFLAETGNRGIELSTVPHAAAQVLGSEWEAYGDDFASDIRELFRNTSTYPPGTRDHAREVARLVRSFQGRWKEQLRDTPVTTFRPRKKKKRSR